VALFADYAPRDASRPPDRLPEGLAVREAAAGDRDALARIAPERQGGTLEEQLSRFEKELAGAGDRLILVAEIEGGIVAYGRAKLFRPADDAPANCAPAGWYLGGVIVSPAHRRRGIGAELTWRRLAWIAGRAEEAFYFVNARNRASIDLHARFGFVERTRDFWYPGATFEGGVGILFRAALV
jgi:ribosomal protein S18 acetylase RimI-like enzyme